MKITLPKHHASQLSNEAALQKCQSALEKRDRGDYESARKIHYHFTDLIQLLFVEGNPAGVKSMLAVMGMIENKLRLPLVPNTIKTYEKIRVVLNELNIKC